MVTSPPDTFPERSDSLEPHPQPVRAPFQRRSCFGSPTRSRVRCAPRETLNSKVCRTRILAMGVTSVGSRRTGVDPSNPTSFSRRATTLPSIQPRLVGACGVWKLGPDSITQETTRYGSAGRALEPRGTYRRHNGVAIRPGHSPPLEAFHRRWSNEPDGLPRFDRIGDWIDSKRREFCKKGDAGSLGPGTPSALPNENLHSH